MKMADVVIMLALAAGTFFGGMKFQEYKDAGCALSEKTCALRTGMRKLWADHVVWTRSYIKSAILDNPDLKVVTERLLQNQDDIGNAIIAYYGQDARKQLTELLKEHILGAADLVEAAKIDDKSKLNQASKRVHDNAKDIAAFLSSANPNWSEKELVTMLNEHLKLLTQETMACIEQQWSDDVKLFNAVFDQAMEMADALTNGIVKQFPDKF